MAINAEQYRNQLLTTEEQLDQLRRINDEKWDGIIDQAALEDVPVDNEPQTLDAMRVLHVEFDSLGETFATWRNLSLRAMYGFAHWNSMLVRPDDINRTTSLHAQTARYEPGIHEVTLDLTHDGGDFRTLEDAYASVEQSGDLLAHSEVLSLAGLHRNIFLKREGFAWKERPYLPGYVFYDDHFRHTSVLQFDTGARDGEMGIRPDRTASDFVYGAVPLVRTPELTS